MHEDVNIATLNAMGNAILISAKMVYGKAALLDVQGVAKTDIDLDGDGVFWLTTAKLGGRSGQCH